MDPPRSPPPPSSSAPSGRVLLWSAAALVILGSALLVVLLLPRTPPVARDKARASASAGATERNPTLPSAAARPTPASLTSARARAAVAPPLPSAVDLFRSEAPELIQMGHTVVDRGDPLRSHKLKEIYQFAKEHPNDARPHLIMAKDSMNRGWEEFAIGHYLRACRADSQARGEPAVLGDLVRISGSQHHSVKAGDALRELFGSSAATSVLAAADEATREGDMGKAERLLQVANALGDAPPN